MLRAPFWLRLLLMALLAAGVGLAAWQRGALQADALVADIGSWGALMPLAFVLYHVAASVLFVPRLVMGVAAGALFGFWWGVAWTTAGGLAGALAGFVLARLVNGGTLDPTAIPRIGALAARAEAGGWRAVTLIRLIPVLPHSLVNYAFGLSRVRLGAFLLGSALGMVPTTLVFVNLGVSGRRALAGAAGWLPQLLWGLGLFALTVLLPRMLPRMRRLLQR